MLDELEVLKIVINRLENNSIPYMLSGSVAMNYYTEPRMTRDIDVVVEIEKPERFFNIFKDEFYINKKALEEAINKEQIFNIIHIDELIKIDFIIRKKTDYRINEFRRRKKIKVDNLELFIVSIEDLIISKILWLESSKSELQLRDVKNLLKEDKDIDYIIGWGEKLGISGILKGLLTESEKDGKQK